MGHAGVDHHQAAFGRQSQDTVVIDLSHTDDYRLVVQPGDIDYRFFARDCGTDQYGEQEN